MPQAYLNRIATAVPDHDVHAAFVTFADNLLANGADTRTRALFNRMATRSGIEHRYSVLTPNEASTEFHINAHDFYRNGEFPHTKQRMGVFEQFAPVLMRRALDRLALTATERSEITHVLITTCTGLYAPGLDFEAVEHLGLRPDVERTVIGFMGFFFAPGVMGAIAEGFGLRLAFGFVALILLLVPVALHRLSKAAPVLSQSRA